MIKFCYIGPRAYAALCPLRAGEVAKVLLSSTEIMAYGRACALIRGL